MIEGENAYILITFFEKELIFLDKSDECIHIRIDKKNQTVRISSNKSSSNVEKKKTQIIEWCSSVKEDFITVNKHRKDEIEKIRKHLESNAMYFTESQSKDVFVFRIKAKTHHLLEKCMVELNQILGRSSEKSRKGNVLRATVLEGNWGKEEREERSRHQNTSQREQRDLGAKPDSSKNLVGSLPTKKSNHFDPEYLYCVEELEDKTVTVPKTEKEINQK